MGVCKRAWALGLAAADFLFDFQRHLGRVGDPPGPGGDLRRTCGLGKTPMHWCGPRTSSGTPTARAPPHDAGGRPRRSGGREVRRRGRPLAGRVDPARGPRSSSTNYERLHTSPRATSPGWCATSRDPQELRRQDQGGRDRVPPDAALPPALHGDRRPERLRRTGHVERGPRRAGLQGHDHPVLQEETGQGLSRLGPDEVSAPGACRAGLLAVGLLVGPGVPQAVRPRVRRRPVRPAAAGDREHVVAARTKRPGTCSTLPGRDLEEQREEQRRTLPERCEKAASLVADRDAGRRVVPPERRGRPAGAADPRCGPGERVGPRRAEGRGVRGVRAGQVRVLVTKPSIAGFGLNWQHCAHQTFFPSHSFEQWYQASAGAGGSARRGPSSWTWSPARARRAYWPTCNRKAAAGRRDVLAAGRTDERVELRVDRPNPYPRQTEEVPAWLSSTRNSPTATRSTTATASR
jgi:hypothetical protein